MSLNWWKHTNKKDDDRKMCVYLHDKGIWNLGWIRYKGIIDDILGPNTSICIYPMNSMDTMG
jgi:hypothetical protein